MEPDLEACILELLESRPGSTICPSEAARRADPEDWRSLMEATRDAARRLARQGRIRILQGGRAVPPDDFRGPIRLGHP